MEEQPNCSRRDAAPILFGRGASAPDAVRRLVRFNGELCGRGDNLTSREQHARAKRACRGTRARPIGRLQSVRLELIAIRPTLNPLRACCIVRLAGRRRSTRRIPKDALASGSAASDVQNTESDVGPTKVFGASPRNALGVSCAASSACGAEAARRLPRMTCNAPSGVCNRRGAVTLA